MDALPVSIRPLSMADAEVVLEWRRDPAVAAHLFSERPPERGEHLAWVQALSDRADRREFTIVLEGRGPVGTIGLSHIDKARGEAEFGILLGHSDVRGCGVASAASRLILTHAFETLHLRRIVLRLFTDNVSARRLYARLGFVEDASRAGVHVRGGVARPTTFMRLDRDTWLNSPSCEGRSLRDSSTWPQLVEGAADLLSAIASQLRIRSAARHASPTSEH